MQQQYTSFRKLLADVSEYDDYGFRIRQYFHWRPESKKQEMERLKYNLDIYKEFIKCGRKFPPEINEDRRKDFNRLQTLKNSLRLNEICL